MSNLVPEAKNTHFSQCEMSGSNDAESNFTTNSFYSKKNSAKKGNMSCEISVDNTVDLNNIHNESFQAVVNFNPNLCSSFICDSDGNENENLDNTGKILDMVIDINESATKENENETTNLDATDVGGGRL